MRNRMLFKQRLKKKKEGEQIPASGKVQDIFLETYSSSVAGSWKEVMKKRCEVLELGQVKNDIQSESQDSKFILGVGVVI